MFQLWRQNFVQKPRAKTLMKLTPDLILSHFIDKLPPLWSPWPSLMIIKEKLTAAQETRRQRAKMMVLFIFGVRFFSY
jgi:hypothetical protein